MPFKENTNQNRKKFIIFFTLLLLLISSLLFFKGYNNSKNFENEPLLNIKIEDDYYLETPMISTCSNTKDVSFELRLLTTQKINDISVTSNNENILPSIGNVDLSGTIESYNVYFITINLITPSGHSSYGLTFDFDGVTRNIVDLKHINFDHTDINDTDKSFIFYSPFLKEGEEQKFQNEISINSLNINDFNFHVLGEKLISVDILNEHDVIINSSSNQPTITGYYYTHNGKSFAIANAYHTLELEKPY